MHTELLIETYFLTTCMQVNAALPVVSAIGVISQKIGKCSDAIMVPVFNIYISYNLLEAKEFTLQGFY